MVASDRKGDFSIKNWRRVNSSLTVIARDESLVRLRDLQRWVNENNVNRGLGRVNQTKLPKAEKSTKKTSNSMSLKLR